MSKPACGMKVGTRYTCVKAEGHEGICFTRVWFNVQTGEEVGQWVPKFVMSGAKSVEPTHRENVMQSSLFENL